MLERVKLRLPRADKDDMHTHNLAPESAPRFRTKVAAVAFLPVWQSPTVLTPTRSSPADSVGDSENRVPVTVAIHRGSTVTAVPAPTPPASPASVLPQSRRTSPSPSDGGKPPTTKQQGERSAMW